MNNSLDLRSERLLRAHGTWIPTVRLWRSLRSLAHSHIEVLRAALGTIGVVLTALLWLSLIALLIHEWLSWWAQLEVYSQSPDFTRIWEVDGEFPWAQW